jgi:hypothetical protein
MTLARNMGEYLLVYVFEDVGDAERAQRGGKRFTALFKVEEFTKDGFLAYLVRRA